MLSPTNASYTNLTNTEFGEQIFRPIEHKGSLLRLFGISLCEVRCPRVLFSSQARLFVDELPPVSASADRPALQDWPYQCMGDVFQCLEMLGPESGQAKVKKILEAHITKFTSRAFRQKDIDKLERNQRSAARFVTQN